MRTMKWPFKSARHDYEAVASEDEEQKGTQSRTQKQKQPWRRSVVLGSILASLVLLIGIAFFILGYIVLANSSHDDEPNSPASEDIKDSDSSCPPRQEWRTLTATQQQQYISAVLCLRNSSSILAPESTVKTAYDDFPWIHSRVGYFTHNSAPFLPWHRYFLHVYENTLREKCGYEGGLVYWDWTLDSAAIENSPVFSADAGFGGDGEVGGEHTVSNTGRCVADGPFAGIIVPFYDVKYQPHCLSRGFRDLEGNLGHIDGSDITPDSIEEVLSIDDYERFVALMESRVHDAIPYGISGDFETFTAPYGKEHPSTFMNATDIDLQIRCSSCIILNWTGSGGSGSNDSQTV